MPPKRKHEAESDDLPTLVTELNPQVDQVFEGRRIAQTFELIFIVTQAVGVKSVAQKMSKQFFEKQGLSPFLSTLLLPPLQAATLRNCLQSQTTFFNILLQGNSKGQRLSFTLTEAALTSLLEISLTQLVKKFLQSYAALFPENGEIDSTKTFSLLHSCKWIVLASISHRTLNSIISSYQELSKAVPRALPGVKGSSAIQAMNCSVMFFQNQAQTKKPAKKRQKVSFTVECESIDPGWQEVFSEPCGRNNSESPPPFLQPTESAGFGWLFENDKNLGMEFFPDAATFTAGV